MSNSEDPYHLKRFVQAQHGVFERALSEIQQGRKRSHWMWFIFPQLDGLAYSFTSKRYAMKSLDEAKAYLAHPVLGPRLITCCEAALAVQGKTASEIFGYPDDMKLRSCATLFAQVAEPNSVFEQLLKKYFQAEPDARTLHLLRQS